MSAVQFFCHLSQSVISENDVVYVYMDERKVDIYDTYANTLRQFSNPLQANSNKDGLFSIFIPKDLNPEQPASHWIHVDIITDPARPPQRTIRGSTKYFKFYRNTNSKDQPFELDDTFSESLNIKNYLISAIYLCVIFAAVYVIFILRNRFKLTAPHFSSSKMIFPNLSTYDKDWPNQMVLRYPHLVPIIKIKTGGAGTIFSVINRMQNDRKSAVKILHPNYSCDYNSDSKRFLAEPKVLTRLEGLNISPTLYSVTFDSPSTSAVLWYEMELLDNYVTLRKFIGGKGNTLTITMFKKIFPLLVKGVHLMHSRGVVHRDLTPENIMVNKDSSELRLIDYGLIRFTNGLAGDDQRLFEDLDNIKEVIGKPSYCGPEQWLEGLSSAKEPADWYSVGVIGWELLCGKPPYRGPEESRNNPRTLEELTQELVAKSRLSQNYAKSLCGLLDNNTTNRLYYAHNIVDMKCL